MERNISLDLAIWKEKEDRKPLILWGARQVGKTWILKDFGNTHFKNTVYISFYNNSTASAIFEDDFDIQRIIHDLSILSNQKIHPQETLIFFDEIQNAPKVLESLKYFCEEAREYAVVCAGSLLGVALHKGVSFPVGKVDELRLYPMSFNEFLVAKGESGLATALSDYKNSHIKSFRNRYIKLLKEYYVVGGMPEVVSSYIKEGDFDIVRERQLMILSQYEGDFGKHVEARELPRIKMTWQSLPTQLSKENKKFFFGHIKKGARSKDYEIAIQWLADAGLIHKVNKVTKPGIPLKSYIDFSSFKIYLNDIGLLGALAELDYRSILEKDNAFTEFKGALTEQFVIQELRACTKYTIFYYSTEKSTYEIDFMIQSKNEVVPIEVKAEQNLNAKSLKEYCKKYHPKKAIRTSMADYTKQDVIVNIPLWAIQGI